MNKLDEEQRQINSLDGDIGKSRTEQLFNKNLKLNLLDKY